MRYTKIVSLATGILLLAGTATLFSCKKYINLEPEDATYDQVFWATGANVEKAVSGAYGLLRDNLRADRSHFIFGDFNTDQFIRGSDYWNYADLSYTGNNHYSYVPYLEGTVLNWTRFYGLVNQCHLIVENTPGIADAKFSGGTPAKNQLLGEGYFLRAFAYFYMIRVWGDPVLTRESLKDPLNIPPRARTSEAEALDFCIQDLLKAADLMQLNHERVKADKGAAWALLAHIYAWKHDYANARIYCDKVINEGGYSLQPMDSYDEIWKGGSDESIFELFMKYDRANNEASSDFFNAFLFAPVIRDKNINSAWSVNTTYARDLYGSGPDDRDSAIFVANGSNYMLAKYATINYYDANRPNTYVVDNNLVLLRLADIYLLKAEAAVVLGDVPAARDAVNEVRERANATLLTSSTPCNMDTVIKERRKELYGEGCLAYDNIRMVLTNPTYSGIYLPAFYSAERIAKKGYYWPLNMRALLPQNELLTQNEWWKNH